MASPIYLDWAATTPLGEEARAAMEPYLIGGIDNLVFGGNANSLHTSGRRAFSALENARRELMGLLGAKRPDEIIFTSGATEADDAALLGLVYARVKREHQRGNKDYVPHIIISTIEHDAVLAPARVLESLGCRVTRLSPDRQGRIGVDALKAALDDDTALVSIHAVNNEIGTIQPIVELACAAHARGALMHVDAVQALGKIPVDVKSWGIDAASFSAHKICGPKGIGALYLKAATPFEPLLLGGGQESGLRSGTQNVCGAVGFAAACAAACAMQPEETKRQQALRDRLYEKLREYDCVVASVDVVPQSNDFAPHIVNVCVKGFESETLILRLDMMGFAVSGGSACSSHSLEPSHVLRALGINEDLAYGSLRLSIGRYTAAADIDAFIRAFSECIQG